MDKMVSIICLLMLTLMVSPQRTQAANENIGFSSVASIEVVQTNDQGEKVLTRQPATLVPPGGIVIYTNTFTNLGQEPASDLVITNPTPDNTEYLEGSVTGAEAVLTFSVDGGQSYAAPENLFIANEDGGTKPAVPSDYTHIRWQLLKTFAPEETGHVEFRVRIK
jgi:uncharacterized repeat protein (TIGR01451 family)